MRLSVLVALTVALAAGMAAETKPRPWELTLDERVAKRLDPEGNRRRIKEAADDHPPASISRSDASVSGIVINGSTHPELFLPWELFDDLVKTQHRQRYDASIERYGWSPADFWLELDAIDVPYASLRRESLALMQQGVMPGDGLAPLSHELCAARADAHLAAQARFGPRLQEFLYTEIAPKMSFRSARVIDGPTLVWISRGCR